MSDLRGTTRRQPAQGKVRAWPVHEKVACLNHSPIYDNGVSWFKKIEIGVFPYAEAPPSRRKDHHLLWTPEAEVGSKSAIAGVVGVRTMNSKRTWMCLGVLGALLVTVAARSAEDAKRSKGAFSSLKVGQAISLKNEGSDFTITFFEAELPQSHKIMEIGDNFIVVRDIADVAETSIPIYSIKAIVKVKASKP
jgi:hypothetical protein